MFRNPVFAAFFVTGWLVTYSVLLQFETTFSIAFAMFIFGPALMLWLVVVVLREKGANVDQLGDDEFGYRDKKKEDLWIF